MEQLILLVCRAKKKRERSFKYNLINPNTYITKDDHINFNV